METRVSVQRYAVLAGSTYYPNGWRDYQESFDTLELAIHYAKGWLRAEGSCSWAEVVDMSDFKIAWEEEGRD